MSTTADIGKGAIGGPTGVVVAIGTSFLQRAFRPSKPTVYKIGGQRVTGPEFRERVPYRLPGQRPAPKGKPPWFDPGNADPPRGTSPVDPGPDSLTPVRPGAPFERDVRPPTPATPPEDVEFESDEMEPAPPARLIVPDQNVDVPISAFAPSPGFYPDVLPQLVPKTAPAIVRALPRIAIGVLGRVGGLIGAIFWPNKTADDDTWGDWWPEVQPVPAKGPPRRTRPRTVEVPDADDWYNWGPKQPWRIPWGWTYPVNRPYFDDEPWEGPLGDPWAVPTGAPVATPVFNPTTSPFPTPAPAPAPNPWGDLWPFLVPLLMPQPTPRTPRIRSPLPRNPPNPFWPDPLAPTPTPLTPVDPRGVESPQVFPQPFPNRADPCNCQAQTDRRKRKKDSCTNPISSKRTFTRGGKRFRTITRKIECQV